MRQAFTSIIGAASLLGFGALQANAYPNPEPITGTIPHNTNATIDPSLIRRKSDGKLFLYTTGPGPTDNLGGYVWTADSLYGPWTRSNDSALNEECDAPNIFEADDGTYYMFYAKPFDWPALGYTNVNASSDTHNKALYVRNSTTLEPLSWGDEPNGTRLLIDWSQSYNQLDVNVILSEEGQYLASFGSYQEGLYQIPLEATLDAVINGSDTTNFNMNGNSINHLVENYTWITDPVPNTDLIEASFQFYWDGYYYLFFSSGHAQTQPVGTISIWSSAGDVYKIMVCRSATATGSFVDQSGQSCLNSGGTEILGTHDLIWAPGGQGVLNDTEVGGPIIYYHYVPRTSTDGAPIDGGYNFGWNKLDFSSGWPVLLDPETKSNTSTTATTTAVTSSSTATSVSTQTTSGSSIVAASANPTSSGISVSPLSSTRWIGTIIFLYVAWGI